MSDFDHPDIEVRSWDVVKEEITSISAEEKRKIEEDARKESFGNLSDREIKLIQAIRISNSTCSGVWLGYTAFEAENLKYMKENYDPNHSALLGKQKYVDLLNKLCRDVTMSDEIIQCKI